MKLAHAWQNLILERTGAGYVDNDSDLPDDPDNDDDPGFLGDGDFLPERIYMGGNPTSPEWLSGIPPDTSPIRDPDGDTSLQRYGRAGRGHTSEPADLREFDAYEFGNATQG